MYRFFARTSKQVVGRVLVATIRRQIDQQLSTPSPKTPIYPM